MFNRVRMMMAVALGRMLGSTPLSLHKAAMDHNRIVDVLRTAGTAQAAARALAAGARRLVPTRSGFKGIGSRRPNGAQECARRVRQQSLGLNAASALWVDSQGRRWHTDSHGVHRGFYWAA